MQIKKRADVTMSDLVTLFQSLNWESAAYPERLNQAVAASSCVRTLWDDSRLVGLVTAISDGAMCVYFPYVAIHPEYQGQGWGKKLLADALSDFKGFPHIALIAYGDKTGFYEKTGFTHDREKAALFFKGEL